MADENEPARVDGRTRYVRVPGEPLYDIEARRHLVDSFTWRPQDELKQIFTHIYETNKWGSTETCSGPGSELARTQGIQQELDHLITELPVRSLLDIPCGDFNWMSKINLSGVDYTGADIVDGLIRDTKQYHEGPSRSFIICDLTKDELPKTDLILCRDGLVHLSNDHALEAIKNFRKSASTYLLTTSFMNTETNEDIATGWWRPINLRRPPFNFPSPMHIIPDGASEDHYSDKVLALWRISSLS